MTDLNSMSNEQLAWHYIQQSGKTVHASDCATSVAPAMRPGPCDCDAAQPAPIPETFQVAPGVVQDEQPQAAGDLRPPPPAFKGQCVSICLAHIGYKPGCNAGHWKQLEIERLQRIIRQLEADLHAENGKTAKLEQRVEVPQRQRRGR